MATISGNVITELELFFFLLALYIFLKSIILHSQEGYIKPVGF